MLHTALIASIIIIEQQLEFQFSTASLPPAYDEANRVLGPDIAPLPKIDSITPAVPVEGECQVYVNLKISVILLFICHLPIDSIPF